MDESSSSPAAVRLEEELKLAELWIGEVVAGR